MNPGSIVSQLTSAKEPQRAIYWRLASIFFFAVKYGTHRLERVSWSVCCLMSDTQMRAPMAKVSMVNQTPLNASMNDFNTPSCHPDGRCFKKFRSSRIF